MKNIVYYNSFQNKNITLPSVFKKDRPNKFFFFGDSFADLHKERSFSWTLKVSDHFNATAFNWGMGGASEQSIFYTFAKTVNEERDFTFIFHTHPQRSDKFFNSKSLPMTSSFFKKWDEMITFPCLHLYWADYSYQFSNGKTLLCSFDFQSIETCPEDCIHHMTIEDNSLFSEQVIDKVTDMLNHKKR